MTLRSRTILLAAAGLCVGFSLALSSQVEAAQAKSTKHKRPAAAVQTNGSGGGYWGTNLVRRGPLYNGPDYLGDDPDPNIRFQILRDLDARYGGGGN